MSTSAQFTHGQPGFLGHSIDVLRGQKLAHEREVAALMQRCQAQNAEIIQRADPGLSCKNARMDQDQEMARVFLLRRLRETGLTPGGLAKKAGIAGTTVTRILNGEGVHTLSMRTMQKLAKVAPEAPLWFDDPEAMRLMRYYVGFSDEKRHILTQLADGLSRTPDNDGNEPSPPSTGGAAKAA